MEELPASQVPAPQNNPSSRIATKLFAPQPLDAMAFASVALRDVDQPRDILPQDTREYDSSDWHSQRLFPAPSGAQNDADASPRQGIRIDPDATLLLGSELKDERHCKVYGVMDRWRLERSDLEARVYQLDSDNVPLKVRRHRLRCMKRIASRTELEVSVPNFRILVCRNSVGSRAACVGVGAVQGFLSGPGEEKTERTGPGLEAGVVETTRAADPEPGRKIDACREKKTPYQQESKRARQRDRRQAARGAKGQKPTAAETPASSKGHSSGAGDHSALDLDDPGEIENLYYSIVPLWYSYDAKGQLYKSIHPKTPRDNAVLMEYLRKHIHQPTIDFASAGQMQEYLGVKQREIVSLKRLQSKMGRVEQHTKGQFLLALREKQTRGASSSEQWKAQQERLIYTAQLKVKVVQEVTSALPGIIGKATETCRELKSRLPRIRQQEEESERVEGLRLECEALREELIRVDTWISSVESCSVVHRELAGRWSAIEEKKKLAEAAYREALESVPV